MENEDHRGVVWIVEDSPLEAEMARRALAPTQDTEVIADGSLALERFASGKVPDAIVLDWQLPSVSGVDVCRMVRTSHDANTLPILMLTVQGRKQDIAFAIAAGANDYVTKPYDVAELVARVQTLVRTSHLQRAQLRRARQLELSVDIGAALTTVATVDDLARRCSEILLEHLGARSAALWRVIEGKLALVAAAGSLDERADANAATCATSHKPTENGTFVAVPLRMHDAVVGVIGVETTAAANGTAATIASIADLLALGLTRVQVEQERAEILGREQIARAEAEAANRSKDDFLAVMSHELRTPLNAITGWAAMLREGTLDPVRTKRAIETIERNARAQRQLIEDLLDVTRIESGKVRLERGRMDVLSSIEMALESIRLAADNKGVSLRSEVGADLPIIMGDADRVQQIVWNLLTNAIKFTPQGGDVLLSARVVDDAIEIAVTDTGRGISADFLPHVFERFRQADGSATRTSGGLGLGLAIVKKLVELHGGSIVAESAGLGQGSTFRLQLPIATERTRMTPPGKEPERTSRNGTLRARPELEGLRVLIVDDEPDGRELLKTLLEIYGIEVTACASAVEAYDALLATKQDVVLSDVAMPGEDGLSLIRRVRALSAKEGGAVPAVALTAHARDEDRTSAIAAGFTTHLPKPLNAAELFQVLTGFAQAR